MSRNFSSSQELDNELARIEFLTESGRITEEVAEGAKCDLLTIQVKIPTPEGTNQKVTDLSELTDYFRREGEARLHPWSSNYHRTTETVKAVTSNCELSNRPVALNELKLKFIDKAKSETLRPWEIAVGCELFSDDEDSVVRVRLASLLFGLLPEEQLSVHNWGYYDTFSESVKRAFGERVNRLQCPLYPLNELSELNTKLLSLRYTPHYPSGNDGFELAPYEFEKGIEALYGGDTESLIPENKASDAERRDVEKRIRQLENDMKKMKAGCSVNRYETKKHERNEQEELFFSNLSSFVSIQEEPEIESNVIDPNLMNNTVEVDIELPKTTKLQSKEKEKEKESFRR